MKNKVLIIVPAFNEAENIPSVLADIRKHVTDADIVVVNDGSEDNTFEIAQQNQVMVLNLPDNSGIGVTMQTGYKFAYEMGYTFALQCDGDGQHPAKDIPDVLKPVVACEADLVVGSRYLRKNGYKTPFMRR